MNRQALLDAVPVRSQDSHIQIDDIPLPYRTRFWQWLFHQTRPAGEPGCSELAFAWDWRAWVARQCDLTDEHLTPVELLNIVDIRKADGPSYIRIDDIPLPFRDEFRRSIVGSNVPSGASLNEKSDLAWFIDWQIWVGRLPPNSNGL